MLEMIKQKDKDWEKLDGGTKFGRVITNNEPIISDQIVVLQSNKTDWIAVVLDFINERDFLSRLIPKHGYEK